MCEKCYEGDSSIWHRKRTLGSSLYYEKVNNGVYICTCNVKSVEYECWGKHAFFYNSHFKTLHQSKCCEDLIDNRADAPIFVLEYKDTEGKLDLRHARK